MSELEARWRDLGEFIREQRHVGQLSLRKLSEMAGISNPYLSQIERGLRKPSAEILRQIAQALEISSETLYVRAGILDEAGVGVDVVAEIRRDPSIDEHQKKTLVHIYESFRADHALALARAALDGPPALEAGGAAAQVALGSGTDGADGVGADDVVDGDLVVGDVVDGDGTDDEPVDDEPVDDERFGDAPADQVGASVAAGGAAPSGDADTRDRPGGQHGDQPEDGQDGEPDDGSAVGPVGRAGDRPDDRPDDGPDGAVEHEPAHGSHHDPDDGQAGHPGDGGGPKPE